MIHLLLAVIYLSFISLGLPDALLGSAWPSMYVEFDVPLSYAGIIAMVISAGTVISSLQSDRLTRRFGTGMVTAVSVAMTALALFGFSITRSFPLLCLWAVPYGLGAGSVDASLNNYVALHYASRHMSWLHCMWGIGASVGPYIMGYALTGGQGWHMGYRYIAFLQIVLTIILFFSLPLWKKRSSTASETEDGKGEKALTLKQIVAIPGAKAILITFFCYCALEQTAGLWASSYLALFRGYTAEAAAEYAALLIPLGGIAAPVGLVLIGLGCAPVYPCIIHSTPAHFGADKSQAVIGVQMAFAYVGTSLMPPLFGLIANHIHVALLPVYLLLLLVLMAVMHEMLLRKTKKPAD